ncbi:radical SAM protein [Clostridium algidicarnis]|uniref:Putative pyruvate formate lyase activating enzyme n=1 Tax=Clostridium algidicarnis DSM 15099 TaxID=1121295 RepID=A0A2S6FYU0_9CLOT|nr:radical SAM protein [Clostridium algidicarnis]MBU3204642.1 radical SAM protein [Clostridium algidicarnis]MBU3212873.1 radical SAM protein [Clostridium algidicarnis]MBU3223517.1 radical SAM protein [Clostridium algidicarnis]PPK48780.1 putative pyruvate formate lyase activating enzyme [Clostridium algidicarnis DSM 15099]
MLSMLNECKLCPRECSVNRLNGELGFCKSSDKVIISRAALHLFEEPCISGTKGSGTVFFSNCNLNCVFCQNYCISQEGLGMEVSIERLSNIFLELQKKGASNINLVTPTHYVPQIIESLILAKSKGLSIPILYNSNGYDSLDTINALNGYIDVYLPDLKYFNSKYSLRYSKSKDYFEKASIAIKEMYNQVGKIKFDESGLMQKGVIIRHLMLPGLLFDSKKIIDFIYKSFKDDVYISIMNQYTPMFKASDYEEINKPLKTSHYDALINYALDLGVTNAFIQDSGSDSKEFIPDFKSFIGL